MVDSPLDPKRMREAKALLSPRARNDSLTQVTIAAALFALAALALAVAVVLMPTPWPT
ncbi:MAG TPA: hypothetical protein VMT68_03430 [Caulobacteraceae bacterium]|nr:hypothetical protein [Caulobacteraceae bacterium]